ncbi:MAG: helix-turn-helix domain-containing protein [Chitinivibrionales bacterium]|nr:helix-turn-helix domain-containing protein [Chitinivibrionales bacterium]
MHCMMYLDEHYETETGIRVHRIGSEVIEPAGFTIDRPRGTNDYDLLHFSTPVQLAVGGVRQEVRGGGCIVYRPGSAQWYTGGKRAFTHDWFHFHGPEAERLVQRCGIPLNTVVYPRATGFITDIVRAMCLEVVLKQPHWDLAIASHVTTLLLQLARNLSSTPIDSEPTQKAMVYHRINDVRLAVLGAPHRRWSVARMATRAYLSRARFSALYKEYFGVSPMEDVITMRLQKARWLIENSTMTIKQIARSVGFDDAAYFNRLFKRRVGVTPGKYSRRDTSTSKGMQT